ncbi:IclR family transcriptional regulator [Pseudomonas synxantha]|uniref:IclR family transcriptional regulator n=2 Tax=Pseudomonas synxantha TaxID=47883 RepID=A0ABS0UPK3_9PSED|nr:IclR family transcriptional regulator [Pseudomonas synxantha]MBI6582354.1 IclR family transcriptional regulator [Pseudomonas synxantha]MBI6645403.1 IclR family transcriptional regulator [Pseudomonas synxantha]
MNTKAPRQLASQTLFRGLEVVDAVALGLTTLPQIAAHLGLSASTAHRLASALVQIDYLRFEPRKGYSLGIRLIELGFQAHREADLPSRARPFLEQLAHQTRDTVHLATETDGCVVYLDKVAGARAVQISSQIGGRKRLSTTGVGKALLLDAGKERWLQVLHDDHAIIGTTISDDQWLALMGRYAEAGYAFDQGEDDDSIRCVAAPIRDATQKIVAAVSVSSAVQYMDEERLHSLIGTVKEVAEHIGRQIGGKRS